MSELCGWSEDRLVARHPRYAKLFRRQTSDDGLETDRSSRLNSHRHRQHRNHEQQSPLPELAVTPGGRSRRHLSPTPRLPAPPKPSADKDLHTVDAERAKNKEEQASPASPGHRDIDIWRITAVEAVNMLCAYVELLIEAANKKPARPLSPPVSSSSSSRSSQDDASTPAPSKGPQDGGMDSAYVSAQRQGPTPALKDVSSLEVVISPASSSPDDSTFQKVPRSSRTPIDSPVSNPRTPTHSRPPSPRLPHIVVTEVDKKLQTHHLAKRFFCKSVPNVSLAAYLGRIHKYCYLSTAVYLAAGMYIERLSQVSIARDVSQPPPQNTHNTSSISKSIGEEDVPIVELTPRSVHRLLLAALRVANKALSDLYWPHRRFADVGGVSQLELQRLEVSMCYLCDFKLQVNLGELEVWVRRIGAMGVRITG